MNSIPRVMSLYLVRHFILFLYLLILNGCFSLIAQTKDEMVLIPEGVFTTGYNIKNKNERGDTDEGPVHKVFLKPYYIDRYEVSASKFSKFLNHHQKNTPSSKENTPLFSNRLRSHDRKSWQPIFSTVRS